MVFVVVRTARKLAEVKEELEVLIFVAQRTAPTMTRRMNAPLESDE
jgi:hypothetical protein